LLTARKRNDIVKEFNRLRLMVKLGDWRAAVFDLIFVQPSGALAE
jgi:hypothetical protein